MEEKISIETKRISYFDVAKGILILMVVVTHVCWAVGSLANVSVGESWRFINKVGFSLWVPFYMPCFFVCTGFCTGFNKDTNSFVKSKIIALIWPMILLSSVNNWFIWSMFVALMIYYFAQKLIKNKYILGGALLLLSVVGAFFANNEWFMEHNKFYFIHAFGLTIFLFFGQGLKAHPWILDNKWISFFAFVVFVSTFSISFFGDKSIPAIYSKYLVKPFFVPLHWLIACSGSIVLIKFSKWIHSNRILEFLGRNSLIIYFLHVSLIVQIVKHIPLSTDSYVSFVFIVVVSVIVSSLISAVLNTKYFCWILGKKRK